MKIHPGFVGIDISKDFLDVFDVSVGMVRRFGNRPEMIDQLEAGWAGSDVFVCLRRLAVMTKRCAKP